MSRRNARPRDELGRPQAFGAAGEPTRDEPPLPPVEALAAADRLFAAGRPFAAHEVLEAVWKVAAPAERDFWRGVAQVAVAVTHARRGNRKGAAALAQRASDNLGGYATAAPYGVDITALLGWCRAAVESPDTAIEPPALTR
jgi:hypothetical protein